MSILDRYLVFCSPPIQTTGENVSPTHILISHNIILYGDVLYMFHGYHRIYTDASCMHKLGASMRTKKLCVCFNNNIFEGEYLTPVKCIALAVVRLTAFLLLLYFIVYRCSHCLWAFCLKPLFYYAVHNVFYSFTIESSWLL